MSLSVIFRLLGLVALVFTGCGYTLQGTRNPLAQVGVERIYVKTFKNSTFRPGVEQMFTTSLIRELEKSQVFRLVGKEEQADAILSGEIIRIDGVLSASKGVSVGERGDLQAGTEYRAEANCLVQLHDKRGRLIFSQAVSGSKVYPGLAITGARAATVPLVNESEQRLALQYLSTQLMSNVYQRMIDIF
jgi:outer membrane lipopolysaccharide assembly protein LptE/RlpB